VAEAKLAAPAIQVEHLFRLNRLPRTLPRLNLRRELSERPKSRLRWLWLRLLNQRQLLAAAELSTETDCIAEDAAATEITPEPIDERHPGMVLY